MNNTELKKLVRVTDVHSNILLSDGVNLSIYDYEGVVMYEGVNNYIILFPKLYPYVDGGFLNTPEYIVKKHLVEVISSALPIDINTDTASIDEFLNQNDEEVFLKNLEDLLNQIILELPDEDDEEVSPDKGPQLGVQVYVAPNQDDIVTTTFGRHKVINNGKHHEFPTGAIRSNNNGKPRMELISPYALEALGECFADNASEYGEGNYLLGIPPMKAIESLLRHLNVVQQGFIEGNQDKIAEYKNVLTNAIMLGHSMKLIEKGLYNEKF